MRYRSEPARVRPGLGAVVRNRRRGRRALSRSRHHRQPRRPRPKPPRPKQRKAAILFRQVDEHLVCSRSVQLDRPSICGVEQEPARLCVEVASVDEHSESVHINLQIVRGPERALALSPSGALPNGGGSRLGRGSLRGFRPTLPNRGGSRLGRGLLRGLRPTLPNGGGSRLRPLCQHLYFDVNPHRAKIGSRRLGRLPRGRGPSLTPSPSQAWSSTHSCISAGEGGRLRALTNGTALRSDGVQAQVLVGRDRQVRDDPGPRTARRRARPDAVLAEPIVSIEVAAAEVSVVEV